MEGFALEAVDTLDVGHATGRERAGSGDKKAAGDHLFIVQHHFPELIVLDISGSGYTRVETIVLTHIHRVGRVIGITEHFRLGGEILAPLPFRNDAL
ncbi:hypothetical protein D3C85_1351940 [compost metagenome]